MGALLVAAWIMVQGPGGQVIWVNPETVVSVRAPRGVRDGHWPADTQCLITTVDGKFITTSEPCSQIERRLRQ